MSVQKRLIIILCFSTLTFSFFYAGYRLYTPYKEIRNLRETVGIGKFSQVPAASHSVDSNWKLTLLDNNLAYTDGAHNLIPRDLDGDGKIELIGNSHRSDALMLYQYNGDPSVPFNWSRYVIDSSAGGDNPRPKRFGIMFIKSMVKERLLGDFISGVHYTAIADINNDGKDDLIVANDNKTYDVVWYESPDDITDFSTWIKHPIYQDDTHRTYHLEIGDIDGDEDIDIVFTTKTNNSVGWLQNNGTSGNWPVTWIDLNCLRCFNARVADLDKNGRMDVVASEDDSTNGGIIHVYTLAGDPTRQDSWIDHEISRFPNGEGVSVFEIIDIDIDGDLDIVTANHQGYIYILENPYPQTAFREWQRYKVTKTDFSGGHDFREIDVGDIDNDGDSDIIVADEGKNQVIWFENDGSTFYEGWKEHVVDKSDQYLRWCHSVALGDIDRDGDLDIAVAAAASNVFLWYSNEIKHR